MCQDNQSHRVRNERLVASYDGRQPEDKNWIYDDEDKDFVDITDETEDDNG